MYTVYPNPGSFINFCERNPGIQDRTDILHHLAEELSMWRATSPDIDLRRATLSLGEASLRNDINEAIGRGESVDRLADWPQVGEYEVPAILGLIS